MDKIELNKDSAALPVHKIVDVIRDLRNAIIKGFLVDDNLEKYFDQRYNRKLSNVKKEFLKKELKEMLISPVDLVHYASLIREVKEQNDAGLVTKNEDLFYVELDKVIQKYCY